MEADSTWWQLTLLAICLLLAAFASLAETALTSLGRIRIRHLAEEGSEPAQLLQEMLSNPGDFLSTILVVNNLAVIIASTLTAIITIRLATFSHASAVTTALLSLFILVFCEITPKTIAIRSAEKLALRLARPVSSMAWLLGWLVRFLSAIPPILVRLFGGTPGPRGPFVTEEEIRMLVGAAEEEGVIEEDEEQMIHSIFEFGETPVREIMVPRVDMITVVADTPVEQVLDLMLRVGHSRLPVYEDTIDNVVGIAVDHDLFKYVRQLQPTVPVKDAVRPAYFVPESKKADELLRELQAKRIRMAIVIDEYGGTAGSVTVEDILEEIVGEIQDESDAEEAPIEVINENEAVFNALVSVADVNRQLDLELEETDVDTLGGYVYLHLGKMPTSGDEFEVDHVSFKVISTAGRRIKKVRVTKHQDKGAHENGQAGQPEGEKSKPNHADA